MKTFIALLFTIPCAIVLRALIGPDQPWYVHMSAGSSSFMLAYTFVASVWED